MRACAILVAAFALACGPTAPAVDAAPNVDAGLDAAAPDRLTLAIEGSDLAFARQSTCFHAAHTGGPDAVVSIIWADGTTETLAAGVNDACHTYMYPGPLVMGMSVDALGMHAEATLLVHVVFQPAARRPTAS